MTGTDRERQRAAAAFETADTRALRDYLNLLRSDHQDDQGRIGGEFTLHDAMRLRFLRYRYLSGAFSERR